LIGTLSSSSFSKGATLIAEYWAGDGSANTTRKNTTGVTVENSDIFIQMQNTFVNCSAGHCFYVSAGAYDADGSSEIVKTNISTANGTCYHYSNTTAGNYLEVKFKCSGNVLQSTDIIIGFNESNGAYVQTGKSSNTYPNNLPPQPVLTSPDNNSYINSITMTWTGSDPDGDTVHYHVLVNGTQVCYTTDLNCPYSPADGYYTWSVTPYDETDNGTTSESWFFTYDTEAPSLQFVLPTEPNETIINRTWTQANMTIDSTDLELFKFNWNGTNYTFYNDSLILGMNFNNNSAIGENSTYMADISSYGNNGACDSGSGTCPSWTSNGKFGGAFIFDGDYIEVNDSPSLDITDKITISGWINVSGSGGSGSSGDWEYKKPITLSPSTPEDNYQVRVNITEGIYNLSGLVGSWHFNDGSGTRAEDRSGEGNDGTLTNMVQMMGVGF